MLGKRNYDRNSGEFDCSAHDVPYGILGLYGLRIMDRLRLYAIGTDSKDTKIWSSAVAVVIARDVKEAQKLAGGGSSKYVELEFFKVLKHRQAIREFAANLFKGDLKL